MFSDTTTRSIGPIRCAWRDHRHGTPAQPLVSAWLAEELGSPADALGLYRDARDRPRLGGRYRDHDVGWSHSGSGLLMATGSDVQLGIDVELQRPRPRALQLAQRFFTGDEADALARRSAADRDAAFVTLWCAKEAVLKAHGHGLSFGLHRLGFVQHDAGWQLADCDPALGCPGDWTVHGFTPAHGYVAALAWR